MFLCDKMCCFCTLPVTLLFVHYLSAVFKIKMTLHVLLLIWVTIFSVIHLKHAQPLSISSELRDIHTNREYRLIFNDEIGYDFIKVANILYTN